jgi:tetratricopeptide (TPR) repeat protein
MLLLLAVALLFGPAVNFEFLNYDDPLHVSRNHLITHFVPAKLTLIWGSPIHGLYTPLTYTTWVILGRLSAWLHPANDPTVLDPAVFHTANIILHAGTVLVVFAILRLLLQRDWPAAFGALLFGLHPVQVAPVAWVSEMKGLLAGFLSLLAIWQYLGYTPTDPAATFFRRHRRYLAALAFFGAALLAKPSVVSVPLIAAALAVLLLKRDWRRVALELTPWLLLAIPLIFITREEQPAEVLNFLPNFWQSILVAGDAITFYHSKLLWPFRLAPDYGRDPQEVLGSNWVYLTGLLPYVVAVILFWWIRRRPWLAAGGLVFVTALLPVLGFIPFVFQANSTVANRYLYLAMLAPALMLGRTLCQYPGRRPIAVAAILLTFLAMRSADRLRYFHDSLIFNRRTVEINPDSYLAFNNLGVAYKESGLRQEATAAFKQAIANAPDRPAAYANLGVLYAESGFPEEAKECYLKALDRNPLFPAKVYLMLGILAGDNGKTNEALDYYQKALENNPGFAPAYAYQGLLYAQLEQFDTAIANYLRALEIDPYLSNVQNNLGLLYEMTNRKSEAIAAYRQDIWLEPTGSDAFNNLGRLLLDDNRPEEAIPLLQQATALYPDQLNPANNLALAYLSLGRAGEAAAWFRRALSIDPGFTPARENLARTEALEKTIKLPPPGATNPDAMSGQ